MFEMKILLLLLFISGFFVCIDCQRRRNAKKILSFKVQPESKFAKLGELVSFECLANYKSSKIDWLFNGEPIKIVLNKKLYTSSNKLYIHLPEQEHEYLGEYSVADLCNGEIQCRAEANNQVLLSEPVKILLATIKEFAFSENEYIQVDVKEQNVAVIPCQPPYSQPKAKTEFWFNNTIISSSNKKYHLMPSGNLQLFNVTMDDSGYYTCEALNPLTNERRKSSVSVALHIEKSFHMHSSANFLDERIDFTSLPKTKYSEIRGSDVVFECAAFSFFPVHISWKKENEILIQDKRHYTFGGNLAIDKIEPDDEGTYSCNASNGYKSIVTYSKLEVKEIPRIWKTLDSKLVNLGDRVQFECSASGNPKPMINWFFNGKNLTLFNQNELNIEVTGIDKSKLLINSANIAHNGIIQCFASNDKSTVYSVAKLTVQNSRRSSNNLSILHENEDNQYKFVSKDKSIKNKKMNTKTKLKPPYNVSVTRLSSDSIMVYWHADENAGLPINFFKIQYKTDSSKAVNKWITLEDNIPFFINSYAVTGLKSNENYTFRVFAVFSNENNVNSRPSKKFYLYKIPNGDRPTQVPNNVQLKPINSTTIEIFWDFDTSHKEKINGFFIHYRLTQSAETYHKITVKKNEKRSFLITHLSPSKQYDFRIQSFNSAGVSDFSKMVTIKTPSSDSSGSIDEEDKSSEESDLEDEDAPDPNSSETEGNFNKLPSDFNSHFNEINILKSVTNTFNANITNSNSENELRKDTFENKNNEPTIESNFSFNYLTKYLGSSSIIFYVIILIVILSVIVLLVCCLLQTRNFYYKNRKKIQPGSKTDLDIDDLSFEKNKTNLNVNSLKKNCGKLKSKDFYYSSHNSLRKSQNGSTSGNKLMFKNGNMQDSSLMNIRVNKFCEDSDFTNSLLTINKLNLISRRESYRMSSNSVSQHNISRLHNKNLLLPEIPVTNLNVHTLNSSKGQSKNFEELYGTTRQFATINRSNSFARLNGTIERKRRSRNDLFTVLDIKEESEPMISTNDVHRFSTMKNFRVTNNYDVQKQNEDHFMHPNSANSSANNRNMLSMMQSSC